MSKWLLAAGILFLGGALVATDTEARRLGGGRNMGAQRNVTAPPAQTPAKQAQGQQQGGQQAAPASTGSRWAGILGGLAIGGLLGYMFGGSGLLGILMIAALVILAVVAVRALAARRQETRPMQYAGMRETVAVPMGQQLPATAPVSRNVPAGFNADAFLRGAKLNFLKLQAANDAGRLHEIREFTTNELFEELKRDIAANGQRTEVIGLEAEMLELSTEGEQHWASVRFSGQVREAPDAPSEPFVEVWNLAKPADGSSGWLLAGIQQMH
jgi:predicted lipid-binding transport protein (Tim44 family)